MSTLEGRELKQYYIQERVGSGGMSTVYRAWDRNRRYLVAIKVLHDFRAQDQEFVDRFMREAATLDKLSHSNIVRFYEFAQEGSLAYIVMDYVHGQTLKDLIEKAKGRPMAPGEVLWITQQVCAALHYAHQEGMIHRDVKPGNMLVRHDGHVLMTDFGIAKAADSETVTAGLVGTAAYMSPEQCLAQRVDRRTDIYSLGIVVYEMLAGRRPFIGESKGSRTGTTRERILWEHRNVQPLPLRRLNPRVSSELEEVVNKALAKERQGRWPTARAFQQALEGALPGVKAIKPRVAQTRLGPVPSQPVSAPPSPLRRPPRPSRRPTGRPAPTYEPQPPAANPPPAEADVSARLKRQRRQGIAWLVIGVVVVVLVACILAAASG